MLLKDATALKLPVSSHQTYLLIGPLFSSWTFSSRGLFSSWASVRGTMVRLIVGFSNENMRELSISDSGISMWRVTSGSMIMYLRNDWMRDFFSCARRGEPGGGGRVKKRRRMREPDSWYRFRAATNSSYSARGNSLKRAQA